MRNAGPWPFKINMVAAALMSLCCASAFAQVAKDEYLDFEGGPLWVPNGSENGSLLSLGSSLTGSVYQGSLTGPSSVGLSFKGVSQFDLRNLIGGSYIPPDTMGAVGASQYMETTNGVYAVYNKSTGALQSMQSAATFWTNAGATGGLNGDARLLFDSTSQRWVALQFGASVADIQIAVSTTSDALGPWKSTKFTGFAGGTADYPTLAIDSQAIYIGTNNFNSAGTFSGTTLNVIARSDLLGPGAPSTASLKQFSTPYVSGGANVDGGYAIQGVNSTGSVAGRVMSASLFYNDSLRFNITNPGTASATKGTTTYLGLQNYTSNSAGRQPDGTQNIDTFDSRIGASVWEKNGKIYAVYNATSVGATHTEVRIVVTDANSNAVLQQLSISDPNYDFYQGSISVNDSGQVVVGYNRSGFSLTDGNVSVMARTYSPDSSGNLVQTNELLLHTSTVSDYHNGSVEGAAASGRQRWGDYSSVTVDPNDPQNFWVIGEYAESWNNANGCSPQTTPGCNLGGGSSWGTWISEVTVAAAVPESSTYLMMAFGLFAVGGMARRRSRSH